MSKKMKIEIRKDDDLAAIDEELDTALLGLESANKNVLGLLESIETEFKATAETPDPSGEPPSEESGGAAVESSAPDPAPSPSV